MRPYPTSLQQHNRPPGEHPLQLRFQLNAPPSRERHRGMEAEVPLNIQQHSATFSNIQQHSATFSNIQQHSSTFSNIQQHSSTFSNTHQHSATFSNIGMHKMEPQELAKAILASGVLYQLWKMTNEKVRNLNTKEYTDKPKYIPSRFHHASSATVE